MMKGGPPESGIATSAMRMAQERQMMEDTSPRDQYNRSVKEANAAYAEALRECSRMA